MAPGQETAAGRRPLIVAAFAVVLALSGCSEPRGKTTQPGPDPGAVIETFTGAMSGDGPYRNPNSNERSRARDAVRLLLTEPKRLVEHDKVFGSLGFSTFHGADPATGRPFTLFVTTNSGNRAWGALLVDRSAVPRFVIEVPHPRSDIDTEKLGTALHRQVPGSVLLVAGAHRAAAGGTADVAHNSRSLFHVLATEFARNGLAQIQLHGFADKNLPDAQVVVSTGSASVTTLARELATGLQDTGLVTCRAWAARCGRLEGIRNEQGQAAADLDAAFVHLELGWSVRSDPDSRDLVVRTIAARLAAA